MNLLRTAAVALISSFVLFACGQPAPAPGDLVASTQQRITQAAPQADLDAAVTANNTFAFDLYRQVRSVDDNVVFSPASITTALAMTYGGARGTTATAFETTLHQTLPSANYHRAMNTLEAELTSRGVGKQGVNGQPFTLSVLNQLFAQKGYAFEQPFIDLLGTEYGANVRLLDFAAATEASRKAINAWVASTTNNLIPELLSEGTVTADTKLALVNTVYFNAAWATKFDKNSTFDGTFHTRSGSAKTVKMMSSESLAVKQAVVDGTVAVELPYDGGEVSMLLLMPADGTLDQFEQHLDGAQLAKVVGALQARSLALQLPKFNLDVRTSLGDTLSALGLGIAFTSKADFSGISAASQLAISDVIHQAVVKVDEAGTEAAAATAVLVGDTSAALEYTTFDRPFLFVIRDVQTGAALFVGRVGAP
jgi:serpin B